MRWGGDGRGGEHSGAGEMGRRRERRGAQRHGYDGARRERRLHKNIYSRLLEKLKKQAEYARRISPGCVLYN